MLDKLFTIGWADLFIPTHSVAEMVVRGTLMYLALFIIFRFVVNRQRSRRRHFGCARHRTDRRCRAKCLLQGIPVDHRGVVLVLTIILWDLCLDWLEYHWRPIAWLVRLGAGLSCKRLGAS